MSRLTSFRTLSLARLAVPQLARNSRALVAPRSVYAVSRAFSTTFPKYRSHDDELLEIVNSELKFADSVENELDHSYTDFLKLSGFKVVHEQGKTNVKLEKTSESGEQILVFFDISEVSDIPAIPEGEEDGQLDYEEELLDLMLASIRILVLNPAKNNALFFDVYLQNTNEDFFVESFSFKPDLKAFLAQIESGSFGEPNAYEGPNFSNLDESLQTLVEVYLKSRGVDKELAEFIFEYSDVAEELAYRDWLQGVAKYLQH